MNAVILVHRGQDALDDDELLEADRTSDAARGRSPPCRPTASFDWERVLAELFRQELRCVSGRARRRAARGRRGTLLHETFSLVPWTQRKASAKGLARSALVRVLPWSGHWMSDFFECVRLKWRSAEQRAKQSPET